MKHYRIMKMSMEKLEEQNNKLKELVKQQKKVIEMLSNEEVVVGLKNAVEDFKNGRYEVVKNY